MPYLTPNSVPPGVVCRVLFIPDDLNWIANVYGALQALTFPENFTPYGAVSPDDTAEIYGVMFDQFLQREGMCRMVGEVVLYAGTASPDPRWLFCDGNSYLRTAYPDLFAVIGTLYGSVDATHFNVPDLRGRVAVGEGTGPGLSPRALGDTFGEETHVLTVTETPSHTHTDLGHTHSEGNALPTAIAIGPGVPAPSAVPGISITGSGSANLTYAGGDGAHNNLQPSVVLGYYIVASDL